MNLLRVLLAAALVSGCSGGGDGDAAPPARPAPAISASGPSTYVALGDSVAAGVGAAVPSEGGYVALLGERLSERLGCTAGSGPSCPLRVRNLAVSGATTSTLLREQLAQAQDLLRSEDVRLVTVTIGGNDLFEPVLRACAGRERQAPCRRVVAESLRRVEGGVDRVLAGLAEAAGPQTTIAVMTYYDPLSACRLAPLSPFARSVLEGSPELGPGLNDVLRAQAQEHGVQVVETDALLQAPGAFVGGDDCLHPSAEGHRRLAEAFDEQVGAQAAQGAR